MWSRIILLGLVTGLVLGTKARGAGASAPAAEPPPRVDRDLAEDYSIRVWRQADGLPSDNVQCVLQTSEGYLWTGTAAGLGRFDGIRWMRFDHGNVPRLADHRIVRLTEDAEGDLWVATEEHAALTFGRAGWEMPELPDASWSIAKPFSRGSDGSIYLLSSAGWLRSRTMPDIPGQDDARTNRWERVPSVSSDTQAIWMIPGGNRLRLEVDACLVEDSRGSLVRRFQLPSSRSSPNHSVLVQGSADGAVWIFRGNYGQPQPFDLHRWKDGELRRMDDDIPSPRRLYLVPDGATGVWYGTDKGVVTRASATARFRYRLPGTGPDSIALDVATTPQGGVWIAIENGGLLQLRPRRVEVIRPAEGGKAAMVRAVDCAPDGVVWAGTEDGVLRVATEPSRGGWTTEHDGLTGHSVRALAAGSPDRVWAGTARGLFVREHGGWQSVALPRIPYGASDGEGFGSLKVRDLLVRRDGSLWVAAAHQVARVSGGGGSPSTLAFLPNLGPMDLLEDRSGNLWMATEKAGVIVLDGGPSESVLAAEFAAVPGHPEDRWRFAPRKWLRVADGLPSDHAWELCEESDGTLWIAGPRGLLRLPAETARVVAAGGAIPPGSTLAPFLFTPRHGLPELALNCLTEDDAGFLWLGGDRGIYRASKSAFSAMSQGEASRPVVETYTTFDGLPADETNGRLSHQGAVRDPDGRIWMATVGGLACFSRRSGASSDSGPGVAIEEVRADGRVLATTLPVEPEGGPVVVAGSRSDTHPPPGRVAVRRLTRPAVIEPGHGRVIEVHFTGFDDAAPRDLRFRYQLEGYDEQTQDVGGRRVAYFTNLDPGRYRFRVWAAGLSGAWTARPAEFEFTLRPHVWQTWWFRVLAGAAIVGLAVAVTNLRIRQIRCLEQLRRREERVELRNRLARDLHDGVGSGLARLALLSDLPPADAQQPDRVSRQFQELSSAVRDLAQTVREISWNSSPSPISLEHLMAQIAEQAVEFLGAAGIRCRTSLPSEFPSIKLSPDQRSNLYFAAKEAVTNVVRHASATEARIEVSLPGRDLVFSLHDNGRGLLAPHDHGPIPEAASDSVRVGNGNGLPNLRARVAAVGGRLSFVGSPGTGTTVRIEIPLASLRTSDPDDA